MAWRGANVGEPDWATLRDATINIHKVLDFAKDQPDDYSIAINLRDIRAIMHDRADYAKELRGKIKRRKDNKGRHYEICTAINDLRASLDEIPGNADDLIQLTNLLQKMAIERNANALS